MELNKIKNIKSIRVKAVAHIVDVLFKWIALHIFAYHIINPENIS